MNKSQLVNNELIDGSTLPMYRATTLKKKKSKGTYISRTGRWALIDYGDFQRGFLIKAENNKLFFNSKDQKTSEILDMVQDSTSKGLLVFGLSAENMSKLQVLMKPKIEEEILKILVQT